MLSISLFQKKRNFKLSLDIYTNTHMRACTHTHTCKHTYVERDSSFSFCVNLYIYKYTYTTCMPGTYYMHFSFIHTNLHTNTMPVTSNLCCLIKKSMFEINDYLFCIYYFIFSSIKLSGKLFTCSL